MVVTRENLRIAEKDMMKDGISVQKDDILIVNRQGDLITVLKDRYEDAIQATFIYLDGSYETDWFPIAQFKEFKRFLACVPVR